MKNTTVPSTKLDGEHAGPSKDSESTKKKSVYLSYRVAFLKAKIISESWSSRRRPVIQKKMSSVSTKFEVVAEKKIRTYSPSTGANQK